MKAFKRFDLYRKVPRDITEPTLSGAVVSICTVSFALYLFVSECLVYTQRQWRSDMFVDMSDAEEEIQINLDITFPAMPCELLSFDTQDVFGSHGVDFDGRLEKTRLDAKGTPISIEEMKPHHAGAPGGLLTRHFSFSYDNQDVERIRKMISSGEGCRVAGWVTVGKVPGNVHLSTYSHSYMFGSLYQETKNINISHRVNHVSFGEDQADLRYVKREFKDSSLISPLDGLEQMMLPRKDGKGVESAVFEYYTKVVPTIVVPWDNPGVRVHQFTANSNKIVNQLMPSLYLRYDFSPVTVRYTEQRETLAAFLVKICAVIGGVFTVAGLLDSVVHRGIVHLAKKAQLGKLG